MTWDGLPGMPGWASVRDYMTSIERTHGGRVELRISAKGITEDRLEVKFLWSTAGQTEEGPGAIHTSVKCRFPTVGHRTMTGLLLATLHQLDYEIGAGYVQESLRFP